MARTAESHPAGQRHRRWFSIGEGVLPLKRQQLPGDVLAGVTLAALGIPEVMGYTKIAGMPVITGLYTILIPIVVFAAAGLVASSRGPGGRSSPRNPRTSWKWLAFAK
jgi:MFS superfamily sulfate permease-like transporter